MAISLPVSTTTESRPFGLRAAQVVLSLAVVGFVFLGVMPRIADYSAAWSNITGVGWLAFIALVAITVLHVALYWPQMAASLPGLTLGQAAVSNQTSTTVANTVPAGGVVAVGVTYSMYRSWGFSDAEIALSTVVTFIWNLFAKLGLPVVAFITLAIAGRASGGMLVASTVGLGALGAAVAVLALMLWKEGAATRVSLVLGGVHGAWCALTRKSRSSDWGGACSRFRTHTIRLVLARWRPLTVTTLASHVALYLVLLIALRSVGISGAELTWTQVLGVFAVVRLLSAFPITPGGVGFVELGFIGGLVLAAGHHAQVPAAAFRAQVAAAVLIFRALTYAVPIPIGALTYLVWKRKKSWRASTDRLERKDVAMSDFPVPVPVP
jgi:putative heme transporter